jgi:hypothetical protein
MESMLRILIQLKPGFWKSLPSIMQEVVLLDFRLLALYKTGIKRIRAKAIEDVKI